MQVMVSLRVSPLFNGPIGTHYTLLHMRALVRAEAIHPLVRQLAASIAMGAGSKDGRAQAGAIRYWIEDHTQFLRDPHDVELIQGAVLMVRQALRTGTIGLDCDDVAVLAAALGTAVGLRARFVAVAFLSPLAPFRHVWAELASPIQPGWLEMDVTRPAQPESFASISRRLIVEV